MQPHAPSYGQTTAIESPQSRLWLLLMVERRLQRAGIQVTAFLDAECVVATLRERPQDFHVVLSDFKMTGMSGLQIAKHDVRLRDDLPVALISGDISDELRIAAAAAAGVAALVPKQDAFAQLAAVVQQLSAIGERTGVRKRPETRSAFGERDWTCRAQSLQLPSRR